MSHLRMLTDSQNAVPFMPYEIHEDLLMSMTKTNWPGLPRPVQRFLYEHGVLNFDTTGKVFSGFKYLKIMQGLAMKGLYGQDIHSTATGFCIEDGFAYVMSQVARRRGLSLEARGFFLVNVWEHWETIYSPNTPKSDAELTFWIGRYMGDNKHLWFDRFSELYDLGTKKFLNDIFFPPTKVYPYER